MNAPSFKIGYVEGKEKKKTELKILDILDFLVLVKI